VRGVELLRDELHHRDREPSLGVRFRPDLPLGEVEQRDHRRHLPPLRIARDDLLRERSILLGPLEAFPAGALRGVVDEGTAARHYCAVFPCIFASTQMINPRTSARALIPATIRPMTPTTVMTNKA